MSVLASALEKSRAQVRQRRLRLDDFFASFDRLRTGRITAAQFARVLTVNCIQLSEEERDALTEAFQISVGANAAGAAGHHAPTTSGKGSPAGTTTLKVAAVAAASAPIAAPRSGEVSYVAFLEAIRPASQMMAVTAASGTARAAVGDLVPTSQLTQVEEDAVRPTVHLLRHAIRTRGLDIASAFRDMDKLNTGLVTAAQFERCMPMIRGLKPEVVRLFTKKYGDGSGHVSYMRWCRDVDESLPQPERVNDADASVESKSHNAAVTAATKPTNAVTTFSAASALPTGTYTNARLTAAELVSVIREQCALYRLRCDDALRDADRHQRGTVSAAQFESAIGRLRFVRFALTRENVATLVAAYATGGDRDRMVTGFIEGPAAIAEAAVRVNYGSFLFDIDPRNFGVEATGTHVAPSTATYYAATRAPDAFMSDEAERAEATRVLEKVARLVRTNRIFLSPVLRDFDRAKKAIYEHRTCTRFRFARGLATQKLLLSPEELNLLVRKYAVKSVDGSPSDDVNYYQFVLDVDPPQVAGAAATAGTAGAPGTLASVTVTRPATSRDDILLKIAQQCADRELRVGEFLTDFDLLRSGAVGRAPFVTALTIAGIRDLEQRELDALMDSFPSGKARGCVDAHAFLREISAYAPGCVPSGSVAHSGSGNDARTATIHSATGRATPTAAAAAPAVSLTAEDAVRLERVLARVRRDVAAHSALLMPFFADFDRLHLGRITGNHFGQALARHRFPLDKADTALLCKAYGTPGSCTSTGASTAGTMPSDCMVAYRRFVRDVSDEGMGDASSAGKTNVTPGAAHTDVATTGRRASVPAAPPASVETALTQLCCVLQERRPRLGEFFPDGDELRHGTVTRARFRHALGILGVCLAEDQMTALEEGFSAGSGDDHHCPVELRAVDYPRFVETVRERLEAGEGVAAVEARRTGTATALLKSIRERAATDGGEHGHNSMRTTGTSDMDGTTPSQTQAEALLAATLARITRALTARRTTTLPAFRAYDRSRKGVVKEGQFFACLASVLGGPLTPLESTVVTRAFTVGNGEMGYLRFSEEVDDKAFTSVS